MTDRITDLRYWATIPPAHEVSLLCGCVGCGKRAWDGAIMRELFQYVRDRDGQPWLICPSCFLEQDRQADQLADPGDWEEE